MQEVFHAFAKDTELVAKLSIKISEVIAEKEKAYGDSEFIKSCLKLFTRRVFPEKKFVVEQLTKFVWVYSGRD